MSHAPPSGGRCAHFAYHLTCVQYEWLFERAHGACELCDVRGEDTHWGRLHVDHYGAWGADALVRGLLCSPCNTHMYDAGRGVSPERLEAYLARAYVIGEYSPQRVRSLSWVRRLARTHADDSFNLRRHIADAIRAGASELEVAKALSTGRGHRPTPSTSD